MNNDTHFAGYIWTHHALDRLGQRGLSQELAVQTLQHPDRTIPGKQKATVEFQKRFGRSLVTVIGKKNERNEWIVLSNWIDPPLPGTEDFKKREDWKKYQKMGFWGKLWHIFKKQLGG